MRVKMFVRLPSTSTRFNAAGFGYFFSIVKKY